MPKKCETNEQFMKRIMTFSKFGALSQVFILDAVQKQAKKIVDSGLPAVKEAFGENSFVSPEAWFGIASELTREIENHYKQSSDFS